MKQHADRTPRREVEQVAELLGRRRTVGDVREENGAQCGTRVSKATHMHERGRRHVQRKAAHRGQGTTRDTHW